MALSVKIVGYSKANNEAIFEIEPPWWSSSQLLKLPGLRKSVLDDYLDYMAL